MWQNPGGDDCILGRGGNPIFYNSPHLGHQVDTFEPAKRPRYLCWPSHLSEKGGPWKVGFTVYSQVEIHGMIRHHVRHHNINMCVTFYRYLSSKSKKMRLLIRKLHHQVALFTLGLSLLATTSAKFIGSENIAPKNTAPPPVNWEGPISVAFLIHASESRHQWKKEGAFIAYF